MCSLNVECVLLKQDWDAPRNDKDTLAPAAAHHKSLRLSGPAIHGGGAILTGSKNHGTFPITLLSPFFFTFHFNIPCRSSSILAHGDLIIIMVFIGSRAKVSHLQNF